MEHLALQAEMVGIDGAIASVIDLGVGENDQFERPGTGQRTGAGTYLTKFRANGTEEVFVGSTLLEILLKDILRHAQRLGDGGA